MGALHGIPAPEDRWDGAAAGATPLETLVYRSNLLGADRALANQGGGNTSSKGTTIDHAGREQRVLWVKGSGTDLASITAAGFPVLRLDEVVALRERETMDDATMVEYLLRCGLAANQPRPSIETLLHAFIPAVHVDHTHPDAIIALTSSPEGRSLAEEAFGSEGLVSPQRPADMSKRIADLLEANPSARAVLLEKHGLVTWGETPERATATIEFDPRGGCGRRRKRPVGLGGNKIAELGEAMRNPPRGPPPFRGALPADADGAARGRPQPRRWPSVLRACARGEPDPAPCPDHLINTKHKPSSVVRPGFDDAGAGAFVARGVEEYRRVSRDTSATPARQTAVPDRPGDRASYWYPASESSRRGRTRAGRALPAISITVQSRCKTRPTQPAASAH
jgi:rhamnose utilization protein RhaD (predicted bifunctional aldolase and dehydrogenase)